MPIIGNKEIVEKFLNEIKDEIIQEQKSQGRVASGRSIEEYEVQVDGFKAQLLGASYAGTLETGRKGGKVPQGFAEIIEDWINAKGIFRDKTISQRGSIAYFIARKIQREGTKLYRDGGDSGVLSSVLTDGRLDELLVLLSENASEQILNKTILEFGKA